MRGEAVCVTRQGNSLPLRNFMNQLILETTMSFLNKVVTPILRWAGYDITYEIDLIQSEDIG